jgi:predicted AlkP superfamily phosphohydrolase/phosphomutase
MARTAPLIFLGLDAFDPDLAIAWAGEGALPNLARLLGEAGRARVDNPFGLFVGSLWVNLASCLRPDRHRFHCWDEIDPATYEWRPSPPRPDLYTSFWKRIGDAGRRVAVIDVPHCRADEGLNGVQVAEWGCHDRHFGLHSYPEERAVQLVAAHGVHPVLGVDAFAPGGFAPDDLVHRRGTYRTAEEERQLLAELIAGARTKSELVDSLLGEEPWDLFVAVFGESHAVGHQQYHLHDPAHPRFDAELRQTLGGDPLLQVYREIDAGVGRILAAAPSDATILVHLSHGMTVHNDGTHLLDELLSRLDGARGRSGIRGRLRAVAKPALPFLRRLALGAPMPSVIRRTIGQWLRAERPRHRAARRYFLSPNNFVFSGVRLNLAGREPEGKVPPGDFDRVCDELERELLKVINVAAGKPAIRSVVRCDRHHNRRPDDSMPDLFIEWDRTSPIETVFSPRVGTVATRYDGWRTGDHRPDGLLLVRAADVAPGQTYAPIRTEDIGASIAARLGVDLDDVDGVPAEWMPAAPVPAESAAAE